MWGIAPGNVLCCCVFKATLASLGDVEGALSITKLCG